MFGEDCVDFKDPKNLSVTVDGKTAYISLETRVRFCLLVFLQMYVCVHRICSQVLNQSPEIKCQSERLPVVCVVCL